MSVIVLDEYLSTSDFARRMEALGPFEPSPHLAVAVSGGGDSMGLVILANRWARQRGGQVTALTIDHGLRKGAAKEAAKVGKWLAKYSIKHVILRWRGDKPITGIQEAARNARYRLMDQWCQNNHILHLLLAHTLDDQAETLLMRLQRGSGLDGLAAMSVQRELTHCRLLRPILDYSRDTLREFLSYQGQEWLEDPSNNDARFFRTRVRNLLGKKGLCALELAETAKHYGRARKILEGETDRVLALGGCFFSGGYARMEKSVLENAPKDVALRAVARLIAAVGGLIHLPARAAVERLYHKLLIGSGKTLTLGRCQLRNLGAHVGVYRERRNLPEPLIFQSGLSVIWDGRFAVDFGKVPAESFGCLYLHNLDIGDRCQPQLENPNLCSLRLMPVPALTGLPALYDDRGIFSVPHIDYHRFGQKLKDTRGTGIRKVRFRPFRSASIGSFCVA